MTEQLLSLPNTLDHMRGHGAGGAQKSLADVGRNIYLSIGTNTRYRRFQKTYRDDRVAFVYDCLPKLKKTFAPYQEEVLANFDVGHRRQAVRGPRGLGKSAVAGILVHHLLLTTEDDVRIPTLASVERQLVRYLWPEIRKIARFIDWSVVGRDPYSRDELMMTSIRLSDEMPHEAFAVAAGDATSIEGAHASRVFYIFDEAKRLAVSTPIPTPDGWTTMGDIKVGDTIFDETGNPTIVTYTSPILYDRPCMRVVFNDGAELIADPGHLWGVLPYARRQIWGQRHANDPRYKHEYARVVDWREYWDHARIVETVELSGTKGRQAIPTCRPLELPEKELPIDPYVLGAWLGDGSSYEAIITSMDSDMLERIASDGHELTLRQSCGKANTYGIVRGGLRAALHKLGLIKNKHIPKIYLRASVEQRLDLLRGLMDTDGTLMRARGSQVSFSNTNRELAEGVAELVRTFGWKVRIRESLAKLNGRVIGPVYILRWSADICPFYIKRKAERWIEREIQASRSTIRTVVSVSPVPSVPTRCIAVDSARHLYLAGEDFIPTHNTIGEDMWDAAEGAFSTEGVYTLGHTGTSECYWLAISTPGPAYGRFYDIHSRKQGYEDWLVRHITIDETIKAQRISTDWVEQKRIQWGVNSAMYKNFILGEFATDETEGVIPLEWIEAAFDRWREWEAAGNPGRGLGRRIVGVDTARLGDDKTVFAERVGDRLEAFHVYAKQTIPLIAGYLKSLAQHSLETRIEMDSGLGAGVYDILNNEQSFMDRTMNLIPVYMGAGTTHMDATGTFRFNCTRSAAWWNMRELLDPSKGANIALMPDDILLGDLAAPKYETKYLHGELAICVEEKGIIRRGDRLGRSTDYGDACVIAFWDETSGGGGVVF